MNQTFRVLSRLFETQVTKSQVCVIHCYNCDIKNEPTYHYAVTRFGTCLDSAGIHHEYLLKPLVTMSRLTYFIPRTHTLTAFTELAQ